MCNAENPDGCESPEWLNRNNLHIITSRYYLGPANRFVPWNRYPSVFRIHVQITTLYTISATLIANQTNSRKSLLAPWLNLNQGANLLLRASRCWGLKLGSRKRFAHMDPYTRSDMCIVLRLTFGHHLWDVRYPCSKKAKNARMDKLQPFIALSCSNWQIVYSHSAYSIRGCAPFEYTWVTQSCRERGTSWWKCTYLRWPKMFCHKTIKIPKAFGWARDWYSKYLYI